jgi:hypothetical protein
VDEELASARDQRVEVSRVEPVDRGVERMEAAQIRFGAQAGQQQGEDSQRELGPRRSSEDAPF